MKKKTMSPEARKKISDGMKRRYATLRNQSAAFTQTTINKPDRSISMTMNYDPDTSVMKITLSNIEPSTILSAFERLKRG